MTAGANAEVRVPVCTVWSSPDAPRDIDEPAVRDHPDMAAWTASMGPDERRGLHGRTETQLLVGEPVVVRGERDGWSQVLAPWQRSSGRPDGYPGWVRSAHVGKPAEHAGGQHAWVVSRTAVCGAGVDESLELSMGTELEVEAVSGDTVTVRLPGRCADLPRSAVRLAGEGDAGTVDDVLAVARGFLGVRYLWGGTSGWGVDCSGLVHLTWRSQGVLLPRDAHEQAASPLVDDVPLDDVRAGDVYFFARPGERIYHVGFATRPVTDSGERWMLHAPEGGELVEDAPLAPHRAETLVAARRVRAFTAR